MHDIEQQNAEQEDEQSSMLEHHTDLLPIVFSKATGDEDLDANGEAPSQGGEHEIEKSCHHRSAELVGAQVPEESRVGESDDGLRQIAQHDGIGDSPNLTVGDARLDHGAKLGNN